MTWRMETDNLTIFSVRVFSVGEEDDVSHISATIESAAKEGAWFQGTNEDEGGAPGFEAAPGEGSNEADGFRREVMGNS